MRKAPSRHLKSVAATIGLAIAGGLIGWMSVVIHTTSQLTWFAFASFGLAWTVVATVSGGNYADQHRSAVEIVYVLNHVIAFPLTHVIFRKVGTVRRLVQSERGGLTSYALFMVVTVMYAFLLFVWPVVENLDL